MVLTLRSVPLASALGRNLELAGSTTLAALVTFQSRYRSALMLSQRCSVQVGFALDYAFSLPDAGDLPKRIEHGIFHAIYDGRRPYQPPN